MRKDNPAKTTRGRTPFVELHSSELNLPRCMCSYVEPGIRKRVRTDGVGRATYDVQLSADDGAVRTFTCIKGARKFRRRYVDAMAAVVNQ